jgi:hypothetical protein
LAIRIWKKCIDCGAIYDSDEKKCPVCSFVNAQLFVQLSNEDIFFFRKKVWSKTQLKVFY